MDGRPPDYEYMPVATEDLKTVKVDLEQGDLWKEDKILDGGAPTTRQPRTWTRTLAKGLYWMLAFTLFLHLTGPIWHRMASWWVIDDLTSWSRSLSYRPHCTHGTKALLPAQAEDIFLAAASSSSAKAALEEFTRHAHLAGTPEDHASALELEQFMVEQLGGERSRPYFITEAVEVEEVKEKSPIKQPHVWTETFYPYINFPISHSLRLVNSTGKEIFRASLTEDVVKEDKTSKNATAVLSWHGLSANGTARGQLVFANTGSAQDYQCLEDRGIDLKGKIVITKYSGVFRGIKVARAAERGAIGVIIYSDPQQDGEITEANGYKAYPDGPARQPSSVQRGSVQNLPLYPGDPTTPGRPADRPDVERDEPKSVPTIPSLPISYVDALPLLQSLVGHGECAKTMGEEWPGAIPDLDYWTGPSDEEVEMVNHVDWKVSPVWNVMATIPGQVQDEVIFLGCHRDAWVFGAADPSSGTAALHEIIKGFGHLLKKGWKPLRTIVIASWDAEEYGLMGSTEFGEKYPQWLSKNVVAYLNIDVAVAGTQFKAAASPLLDQLFFDVTKRVQHPSLANSSVYDGWLKSSVECESKAGREPRVDPLGSGSDFTVFLQSLGIASADMSYVRDVKDPIYHYHSNYDSFHWMSTFGDPTFDHHRAISQVLGLMTLKLADSIILPMRATGYADKLKHYVHDLKQQWSCHKDSKGQAKVNFKELYRVIRKIRYQSEKVDQHAEKLAESLGKARKPKSQRFGLSRFRLPWSHKSNHHRHSEARELMHDHSGHRHEHPREMRLEHAHHHHHHHHHPSNETDMLPDHHHHHHHSNETTRLQDHHHHHDHQHPPPLIKSLREARSLNRQLFMSERGYLDPKGITGREFYKHVVYAPGLNKGYESTMFPTISEAKDPEQAQEAVDRVTKILDVVHRILKG